MAQNRARLSINTHHASLAIAYKETPLQIGETRSIIEGTKLVNSIPNRAHGSTCKRIHATAAAIEDKLMNTATAQPSKALLSPTNHALVLIDFRSQAIYGLKGVTHEEF